MLGQIMYLGMTVVTGSNSVIGPGRKYLIQLKLSELPPLLGVGGLQEPAAAAAAVVVGFIGIHVDEVFFSDNGLDHKPKIIGQRISQRFPDKLAGVLDRKFDAQFLVPIGVDLQLSFPDPLRVIFNDASYFKFWFDVELFQSGPDCKEFVASLGIEPDFTAQILHGLDLNAGDMLPGFIIGQEHTIIFPSPSLGAVGPIRSNRV